MSSTPQTQTASPPSRGLLRLAAAALGMTVLGMGVGFARTNPLDLGSDLAESPASVLPGDAVAYLELDAEPGLGQQVEALRFAAKFPGLRRRLPQGEDTDPRELLWQRLADGRKACEGIDYGRDVEPWLGQRAGLALRAGSEQPVVALETNQEKTGEQPQSGAAAKLAGCLTGGSGAATSQGYLLLAADQAAADQLAQLEDSASLAVAERFDADLTKVGSRGFLSWWATRDGLLQLAPDQFRDAPLVSTAGTLRLADGSPEVRTLARLDRELKTSQSSTAVGDFPPETALAVGLAEGSIVLDEAWPALEKLIGTPSETSDLNLPDDLRTVLGRDARIAVGPRTADGSQPWSLSSYADRTALGDVLRRAGGSEPVTIVAGTPKVPVAATAANTEWAQRVSGSKRQLDRGAMFKAAVAKPEQAQFALFVDLQQFPGELREYLPDASPEDLEALQALGLTGHVEDDNFVVAVGRLTAR